MTSLTIHLQGSAVVTARVDGGYDTHLTSIADSIQEDHKEYWGGRWFSSTHEHRSMLETNVAGRGFSNLGKFLPPTQRADGKWVIKEAWPSLEDTCLFTRQASTFNGDRSEVHVERCNLYDELLPVNADTLRGMLELVSSGPDGNSYSTHVSYETDGKYWHKKRRVNYDISVSRLGKCTVGGSIPLDGKDPSINDEDVEMGVEYGKSEIMPDPGLGQSCKDCDLAPLNIRVTCDGVPIKNAKLDVKVAAQKNTGGHVHDTGDSRPLGSLKWKGVETKLTDARPGIQPTTDDDGRVHLIFEPGKAKTCPKKDAPDCRSIGIAGIYQITATSQRFPSRTAQVAVEAKVDGLAKLDADPNYADDAAGPAHSAGDFATAATRKGLVQFASAFHAAQDRHNQELAACQKSQWQLAVDSMRGSRRLGARLRRAGNREHCRGQR